MFRHAYAVFSLIEWQVMRDTCASHILHNLKKYLQYALQNSETGNYRVKKMLNSSLMVKLAVDVTVIFFNPFPTYLFLYGS